MLWNRKTRQEVRDKKKAYDAGGKQSVAMKAKYTFAEFADVWFERYQEQLKDATSEHYTYILRTIKNILVGVCFIKLLPRRLKSFFRNSEARSALALIFVAYKSTFLLLG